jgi:glycogen operon protein
MLLAGDEFGRTQRGNNNAYCQDNELSWVDWSLCERNAPLVEFVRELIDLRKSRLWLRRDTFLKGTRRGAHAKDVTWLHPSGREMTDADWNDSNLRSIAVHMNGAPSRQSHTGDLVVVFNADESPVTMTPPPPPEGSQWAVVFDTTAARVAYDGHVLQCNEKLVCEQRSTVLLESRAT